MIFPAPLKHNSLKIMLLGSGELGREVAIEAQRLGIEVIALDRYQNAPAHQVAHKAYVVDMKDREQILEIVELEKPTYILPEIEAINIDALFEAEERGYKVIPNALAVQITMNRKNIRKLTAERLGLLTSKYFFVKTLEELEKAVEELGYPAVVKPIMSSSGYGQSIIKAKEEIPKAFEVAKNARGDSSELIVEEFIDFDYEITLLTVKNSWETIFCPPIGHIQQGGDYIFSYQPKEMDSKVLEKAQMIAKKVTDALGGRGIFGVELFVKGDEVYFSEVSPRPHDTGLVTLATQNQSEFALHLRAVLDLPLEFKFFSPGASAAYKATQKSFAPCIKVNGELFLKDSFIHLFGKPQSYPGRRMGVVLSLGESGEEALEKVQELVRKVQDEDCSKNYNFKSPS